MEGGIQNDLNADHERYALLKQTRRSPVQISLVGAPNHLAGMQMTSETKCKTTQGATHEET